MPNLATGQVLVPKIARKYTEFLHTGGLKGGNIWLFCPKNPLFALRAQQKPSF